MTRNNFTPAIQKLKNHPWDKIFLFLSFFIFLTSSEAYSYIGPGAGFAFIGSFFTMFAAIFIAAAVILMWPIRMIVYFIRRKKGVTKSDVGRVVVIGLDGLDPNLVQKYMDGGLLPNFKRLMESGSFMKLGTTCPSISPVAWSSFATGLTPARHGIFDFLDRDLNSYLPLLSSAKIGKVDKAIRLGRYIIPLKKPSIKLLRKGFPFWNLLGEKGISCSVIRVPITFPPEKFDGRLLSAMCTPDLKGSQGTFSFYTESASQSGRHEGGQVFEIKFRGGMIKTSVSGPHNPFVEGSPASVVPLTIKVDKGKKMANFNCCGQEVVLTEGEYSPWIRLGFPLLPAIKADGICRFLVKSFEPFEFYVTPINIDPENPSLPISHPKSYAPYLAKSIGSYATLGLAEDTWALNEKVISDSQFLEQCYLINGERENMFFNELDNVRKGLVVCVFDITDRVQHMFWRYVDDGHPALEGKRPDIFKDAISDVYVKMDNMVGRTIKRLGPDDVLLVMSDHGFSSFKRGVNLNSWLYENGYIALKEGACASEKEWFHDVDWSRTRAYAIGLGGICLNLKGREGRGIVPKGNIAEALKAELISKLQGLLDEERGKNAISSVYDLKGIYSGPYLDNGPELIVGFEAGYRASWEGAKGVIDGVIFKDNAKKWSGDHCIDYKLVPGVLFLNRKIEAGGANIIDIAPTILKAFGLEIPPNIEGRPLF